MQRIINIISQPNIEDIDSLKELVPEIIPMFGCKQNSYHEFDVWEHTVKTIQALPNIWELKLVGLFHDIGKPCVKSINKLTNEITFYEHEKVSGDIFLSVAHRLNFKRPGKIYNLILNHYVRYDKYWRTGTIRRWLAKVGGIDVAKLLFIFARADIIGKGTPRNNDFADIDELEQLCINLKPYIHPIKNSILNINGNDIMNYLNIQQGKEVGLILKQLEKYIEENPDKNTKEDLFLEINKQANRN